MGFEIKKYENPNIAHTIRFTQDLHEKLGKVAEEKNLSFNSLILQCCEFAMENMKPEEKQ